MADEKTSAKSTEEQAVAQKGATVTEESLGKTSATSATEAQQAEEYGKPDKVKCNTNTSCDTTIPWGQ